MRESSADVDLVELAEEPSLSMPEEPGRELVRRDGYLVVVRPGWATVERIRLGDVERAVAEVQALGSERGLAYANWWVGARSTPADLGERLLELGLEPDPEMPLSKTLTLTARPAGEPAVEVRRVENARDYALTREISKAVWPPPGEDERDFQGAWDALAASGVSTFYLAYLDGEPVGFGRADFTPAATLLTGGAVLAHARGRGAYLSLVHARWEDSVARGVPRLLVGAGPMSAPILERLGFMQIGETKPFRQRLGSSHGDDRIG